MPPHPRPALSLDDAEIDFSGATDAKGGTSRTAPSLTPAELLQRAAGGTAKDSATTGSGARADALETAYDPALSAYTQRRAGATGRRRLMFGGPVAPTCARPSATEATAPPEHMTGAEPSGDTEAVRQQQTRAASDFLTGSLAAMEAAAQAAAAAREEQRSMASALEARRTAYLRSLRRFCQQGLPWARVEHGEGMGEDELGGTEGGDGAGGGGGGSRRAVPPFPAAKLSEGQSNSLLCSLFADGVPDVEPWDRWAFALPRYDPGALLVKADLLDTQRGVCDLMHHPVLPESHYTQHYQHARAQAPVVQTLYKTKDELKAERRERLKKKQEEKRRAAAAAKTEGAVELTSAANGAGGLLVMRRAGAGAEHDRLSNRTLVHGLLSRSVLNPVAADSKVYDEYQQRFLEHQQRNHDRHVAALPAQIMKRDRDATRHATERPVLRAYRVYPIYGQAHLGKLRNFANDNRLRGFFLWVAQCDVCVVLSGGEVAARHLDRWLLHKMKWESAETRVVRLCSVPLQDAKSFSFHLKRLASTGTAASGGGKGGRKRGRDEGGSDGDDPAAGREAVFINQCATVAEAEAFLREVPVDSPWENLAGVWRSAFLEEGLRN